MSVSPKCSEAPGMTPKCSEARQNERVTEVLRGSWHDTEEFRGQTKGRVTEVLRGQVWPSVVKSETIEWERKY